jgi:lipopolysaccharide transport system ATP-binding protein
VSRPNQERAITAKMSGDVVIRAEGLGKRYVIGHAAERERYVALRDVLARQVRSLWRMTARIARGRAVGGDTIEEFWALKDVSFEVKRGEVVGIIGRNGAGKSTLLKILSRITEPTEGRVTINGRVASLLEVGTGFHPELTGRENIHLNGAILGMTHAEIRKKFDEIVSFAEVEKFLDTPVKRYSSGMYVRLAFAVAAHLEPEILLVDEVLAVGDAEFQKKCLGKMSEVAGGGRTVLFVSHNLVAISGLCGSALLLDRGCCVAVGSTETIVQQYLADMSQSDSIPLDSRIDRQGSGDLRVLAISLEGECGRCVPAFRCGMESTLHLLAENFTCRDLLNVRVAVGIDNMIGQRIALLDTELIDANVSVMRSGRQSIRMTIPRMVLIPGQYQLTVYATVRGIIADWIKNACIINVEDGDFYGTGRLPPSGQGMMLLDHRINHVSGDEQTRTGSLMGLVPASGVEAS